MRVLGIVGSTGKDTSAEKLIDKVMEGAESAGAHVEVLHLCELDIQPCRRCDLCAPEGVCLLDDAMPYEQIYSADAVVFGVARHDGGLPEIVRRFLARWRAFLADDHTSRLGPFGIHGSVVSVLDGSSRQAVRSRIVRPLARYMKRVQMTYDGAILGETPEDLYEECRDMGRKLTEAASRSSRRQSITCRRVVGMLPDMCDRRLPAAALRAFYRHLDECESCRAVALSYRHIVKIAPRIYGDEDGIPESVSARLRRSLGLDTRH